MGNSISRRTDTNVEWNTGTLTDVVAVNDALELVGGAVTNYDYTSDPNLTGVNGESYAIYDAVNDRINFHITRLDSFSRYHAVSPVDRQNYTLEHDITITNEHFDQWGEIAGIILTGTGISLWLTFDTDTGATTTLNFRLGGFTGSRYAVTLNETYHVKSVVQNGNAICTVKNSSGTTVISETTFISSPGICDTFGFGFPAVEDSQDNWTEGYIDNLSISGGYIGQGNRLSPTIDLSAIGSVESSIISWTETLNGETIIIETSIDGQSTWQTAINGSSIPNLTDTDTTLDIKQTLSTANTIITPRLLTLYLEVISADILKYGGLTTLNGNLYWEPRNSPIFKDSGLLNLKGNMYGDSRSSPVFKVGIDRVFRVKFIPIIWMTAMGEIKQWNTEDKPDNNWQSEVKPNNMWKG